MAKYAPENSVWGAMQYKPPRGRCNFKTSLLSGSCSCLRFMLHPVKAATSFECDGCGHHASFHSLENPSEDAVMKKWSEQEANESASAAGASKKRRRVADKASNEKISDDPRVIEIVDENGGEELVHKTLSNTGRRKADRSTTSGSRMAKSAVT